MMWANWVLGFMQPISACLLAYVVVKMHSPYKLSIIQRFFFAVLVLGLLFDTGRHWSVALSYEVSGTWTWLVIAFGLNGMVWSTAYRVKDHEASTSEQG